MDRESTFDRRPRLGENAGWVVAFGVLRIVVGVIAMAVPLVTGVATGAVVGALLCVTGVVHMVQAFRADSWGTGVLGFLEGVLALAAGVLMFVFPVTAVTTLSLVAMTWLFVDGLVRIGFAFRIRPLEGWGWALFSGVVSVALGIWLLTLLPVSALYTVGVMVGANMIASGWWTVAVGIAAMQFRRERQARV